MKVTKIYSLSFQRNGISGESFYTALIRYADGGKTFDNFLLTFRTEENDKEIDPSSCRAVSLADVTTAWRGDNIGFMMQQCLIPLMKEKEGTIYDCITKTELQIA